jgi:hypothetical protein
MKVTLDLEVGVYSFLQGKNKHRRRRIWFPGVEGY